MSCSQAEALVADKAIALGLVEIKLKQVQHPVIKSFLDKLRAVRENQYQQAKQCLIVLSKEESK